MTNKATRSGGVGCLTVVGIVFLTLKLLAVEPVAGWPWVWVLCPFWLPLALGVLVFVGVFAVAFAIGSRR